MSGWENTAETEGFERGKTEAPDPYARALDERKAHALDECLCGHARGHHTVGWMPGTYYAGPTKRGCEWGGCGCPDFLDQQGRRPSLWGAA